MTPPYLNLTKCPKGQAFAIFCDLLAQETDDCILWPYKKTNGNATVSLGTEHDELIHRLAWIMTHRERIEDSRIWQRCGNLACFNPRHLNKGPRPRTLSRRQKELIHLSTQNTDDCVMWPHYRSPIPRTGKPGYGMVKFQGKHTSTNRSAWLLSGQEIPKGMKICHTCDNPGCVNLRHLFIGTQRDNMQDCIRKGRKKMPKGVNNPSAKLTESQVREIRIFWEKNSSTYGPRAFAEKFKVGLTSVRDVINNRTWRHLL